MFLDSSRAEETKIFAHMQKVIGDFAKRGNCILVGRGAVFAARDLPNCIHLRLVAPYDFRVEKIMAAHKLNQADAEQFIALYEKQRNDFIKRFANSRPDDPLLYHLVINNARLNVNEIAELVESRYRLEQESVLFRAFFSP
jgi:cytidylate kinase